MRQGVEKACGLYLEQSALTSARPLPSLLQTVAPFPHHTPCDGIQITSHLLRHRTESMRLSCHQNQSFFDSFHKFIQIMNGDLEKE